MQENPALQVSRQVILRRVSFAQPLHWLAAGWRDLWRCPGPGLLHGAACALFGAVLLGVARGQFWLLAGAFSGFMLVAPILATGLYAISRALERGQQPNLAVMIAAWHPRHRRLVVYGLLLALAGAGWVLTSASLITLNAQEPIRNPQDFLRLVVLNDHSPLFVTWLGLGGALAAPIFASSVISIPLLMERRIGVLAAVLTSWRVVMHQPAVLALWAVLLLALTMLGMAFLLLGLVVTVPWLGHASWHAYRGLVDSGALSGQP